MPSEKYHTKYRALRKKIDALAEKLANEHATHMQCRMGCDLCCTDYGILPVEFYSILDELKKKKHKIAKVETDAEHNPSKCIFLKNHSCTIYESRPVICRTHGLPLLFTNKDYEWELSVCELNFTRFDDADFTPENTYPEDKFKSRLFMLNREFLTENPDGHNYGKYELIPLRKLADYL